VSICWQQLADNWSVDEWRRAREVLLLLIRLVLQTKVCGESKPTVKDEHPLIEVELFDILEGYQFHQLQSLKNSFERHLAFLVLVEYLHHQCNQHRPN
jgi:hypothetical protein